MSCINAEPPIGSNTKNAQIIQSKNMFLASFEFLLQAENFVNVDLIKQNLYYMEFELSL